MSVIDLTSLIKINDVEQRPVVSLALVLVSGLAVEWVRRGSSWLQFSLLLSVLNTSVLDDTAAVPGHQGEPLENLNKTKSSPEITLRQQEGRNHKSFSWGQILNSHIQLEKLLLLLITYTSLSGQLRVALCPDLIH